jgi:hypothetical protein
MARHLSPERVPRLLISRIAGKSSKPVPPARFDTTASTWFHSLICGVGASHVIGSLRATHVQFVVREELVASVVAGAIVVI